MKRWRFLVLGMVWCGLVSPQAQLIDLEYRRSDWAHWVDDDRDCQDTRQEVLIAESGPGLLLDSSGCRVLTGHWVDPYTGRTFTRPSDLDVDHMVPLAEAHRSGGARWSRARKRAFANDLRDPMHLMAVDDATNQRKGARRPDQWMPPNRAFHCAYAQAWRRIKQRWGLTMRSAEKRAVYDACQR